MAEPPKDKDLDQTKRVMGKLASMPHKPHIDKTENASGRKTKSKDKQKT